MASKRSKITRLNNSLEQLSVDMALVNSISPNDYNPNRQTAHDFYLLILSMWEDGFTQPIIVHKPTSEIIDGEHRWTGWIVMNWARRNKADVYRADAEDYFYDLKGRRLDLLADMPDLTIPTVFTSMDPAQMRIATMRHNKARGSHDVELEAQLLRDLRELGALEWAQDSLQLDDVEVQRLIEEIDTPDALANEEFSEAWVPDTMTDEEREIIKSGGPVKPTVETTDSSGNTLVTSVTPATIELQRKREELLAKARTEKDRQTARQETQMFRLGLTFAGEDGTVVRWWLGNRPAERILEMAQTAWAAEQATAPDKEKQPA